VSDCLQLLVCESAANVLTNVQDNHWLSSCDFLKLFEVIVASGSDHIGYGTNSCEYAAPAFHWLSFLTDATCTKSQYDQLLPSQPVLSSTSPALIFNHIGAGVLQRVFYQQMVWL
jgi:hypothetical protein